MPEYFMVCPRRWPPRASRRFRRADYDRGNSTESVPLGRFFEMNLNDLLGIADVVPLSVGLPTFCDNLNQHFAERWIGNVRDTLAVGFHVQFELLVLAERPLFNIF